VIEPNGTLSNVEIVESRGHESLHRASQAAMEGAAPFRALPADFPEKNLVVTVRFIYLPPGARDVP
jgi:TonB family protein